MGKFKAYLHTKRRVKERYAFKLTMQDYMEMCEQIRQHKAELVNYHDSDASFWKVNVQGQNVLVVHDDKSGFVVSALPKNDTKVRRDW